MHKMMVPMMLIGAATFGPPAAPGDVVQTILPDVSAGNNAWHREYPDKSGVFVYNPSGDGADSSPAVARRPTKFADRLAPRRQIPLCAFLLPAGADGRSQPACICAR